ncbi:MAG: C-terminal binding protein [Alphaproteobacteria bacterium]|nr:C-terminal binding protein [Alphaproteobacteria bacterium]
MFRLLYPDTRFAGGHDADRQGAGDGIEIVTYDATRREQIPDEVWRGCHAIIVGIGIRISREVIERLDACKLIVRMGVGYDNIDVAAAAARGIPVANVPDYGTTDIADTALALILNFARGIAAYDDVLRRDVVANWDVTRAPAIRRMKGMAAGVVGLGRIGTAAALRLKAFDMPVHFYDPYVSNGMELALGLTRHQTLQSLLGAVDAVTIHAFLNDETRNLIDAAAVAAMRRGTILVNTARGPICDLDAIYDGLRSGQLAAAGLDVLPAEPPDPGHKLIAAWQRDEDWIRGRLVVLPHAAYYSAQSLWDIRYKAAETVALLLRDGRLRNCVNGELLKEAARNR